MSIQIGHIKTRNKVFLAPMSGITDLPFRQMAHDHGAGLVVSEMIASKELARTRKDMLQKALRGNVSPFVVQLAGREAQWMAEGAKVVADLGADAVDINMGCPARQVTGSASGSALMKDLDHALTLIEATVGATDLPVTLKMRLGWDEETINAPELARQAQDAGVQMITVHGRTRSQFYMGKADWKAIAAVKDAVSIPLIANGDGNDISSVRDMLEQSGADGIMIGRGAYGRPWFVGEVAEQLQSGAGCASKAIGEQMQLYVQHYRDMIEFYGPDLAVNNARKHLGWMIERLMEQDALSKEHAGEWRGKLMKETDTLVVISLLKRLGEFVESAKARAA